MLEIFRGKSEDGLPSEYVLPIWRLNAQELRDVYDGKFQSVLDQIRFVQDAETRNELIDAILDDVDGALETLTDLADQKRDAGNALEEDRITRVMGALNRFEDEIGDCYFV